MNTESKPANPGKAAGPQLVTRHPLFWTSLLLAGVLSILFYRSFDPNYTLFANDCPLGQQTAEQNRLPAALTGCWADLNWLGNEGLYASPTLSNLLLYLPTPNIWARYEQPLTVLFAGVCACFCLWMFELAPVACILGGLAAGLNSDFFSTSCWGVSSQTIGFGAMYVAIGLMYNPGKSWRPWLSALVAGMAVGVGIMEAYDIGALFSLFVAAFAMFAAMFLREGEMPVKIGKGAGQVALIAIFAALVAAYALEGLIGTQLKNSAGARQDAASKRERWDQYTAWSVPKAEIFQVLIPGIFGFRQDWHMYENDQPKADQYWGTIGASGGGFWRLVGTGFYAGVPVVLIAFWAIFQSLCRRGSTYTKLQRRTIWFWGIVLVVTILLAFGKNAPFYWFFYQLPYASAIRNPQKFMHIFSWAIVILFAYGVHGLWQLYMKNPVERVPGLMAQYKSWRARAVPFEKKWMIGSFIAIGVSLVGWLIYAAANNRLADYIATVGIKPELAPDIAKFSLHAVGWYILFLALTVGLLALIFSGQFAGPRARTGALLLGVLLAVDLARADKPWIVYWNVPYKYQSDSIIKFLADKPYEHRVSLFPINITSEQHAMLFQAYGSHWKQQLFPYNNIECAEVVQEPRVSDDKEEFMAAIPQNSLFNVIRFWQLSSTRYVLGPAGDLLAHLDPNGTMFRIIKKFNFVPKHPNPSDKPVDYMAQESPDGQLALYEFMGALPRAKLFSNWTVDPNDQTALKTLASPEFDPLKAVVVDDAGFTPAAAGDASQPAGSVEITHYKPKRIELQADVKTPSVLLMTDRYNPKWVVEVDGKPAPLLRCDFILRGIKLDRGSHKVVLRFVAPLGKLYLSLASMSLGLIFGVILIASKRSAGTETGSAPAGK